MQRTMPAVYLHVAKTGLVFDDTMQSKIVATVLGLVAEIERDFISARTKEALAKRKADGMKLGRPSGAGPQPAPGRSRRQDRRVPSQGHRQALSGQAARVAPNTLYAWLKVRRSGAAALGDTP